MTMPNKMKSQEEYRDLPDLKKLHKQWHKLSGLHSRAEWSAAVVRAATAAEIAANFALRREFAERNEFDDGFIDSLFLWANGLNGKIKNLLLPLNPRGTPRHPAILILQKLATEINRTRNEIVHGGNFCSEDIAVDTIEQARSFIVTLVQFYEPDFALRERDNGTKGEKIET
jgi:hypothetical protein